MEDRWLHALKKVQALASTGLHFGQDEFDQERYAEIELLAKSMIADLGNVPLSRIDNLLGESGTGYATPRIDVRGAVFKGEQILMVQEKSDLLWTLPGGYADTGLSAAENVEKEMLEEANLSVEVQRLYAVRHKAKHPYPADVRDFYKFFFICEQTDDSQPEAGSECLDVGFFSLSALPPLSEGRVIRQDIEAAFEHRAQPHLDTIFD